MTFIEDAIKALYGDMPVKLVEHPGSKHPHEVFVRHDKDGNITQVVVSNYPDVNDEGKPEVKPPPIPEKADYAYHKPESSIDLQSKKLNLDTGKLEAVAVEVAAEEVIL